MTTDPIAQALLDIGAVKFAPHNPITFKSGIVSPVYVDNRTIPFHPAHWQTVITGFQQIVASLEYDVIAGIETAGIPHSAALAYSLGQPSVFVRKEAKAHGTRSRIEVGDVHDKRVILIEDLITTSLSGVMALRDEGAIVTDVIAIVSYGFNEATNAFQQAGVRLHTLTTFSDILQVAGFSAEDEEIISDWFQDPHGWAEKYS